MPLSAKIGLLYHSYYLEQAKKEIIACIMADEIHQFNSNKFDVFLRAMYESTKMNFKYAHLFHTPEFSIFYQAILSTSQHNYNILVQVNQSSYQWQIFYKFFKGQNQKDELIGLGRQTDIILEFLRELYKKIIRQKSKKQSSVKIIYSFLCFLIQVYRKRTVAYLEILNEKNDEQRSKSLIEKQTLNSILAAADEAFKHDTFMNDHINVLQIIQYDTQLGINQNLLEDCIKEKKELINLMSKNFLNIIQFREKANLLIRRRAQLKAQLLQSSQNNEENIVLKEQIQQYLMYLSIGDTKANHFKKKNKQIDDRQIGKFMQDSSKLIKNSVYNNSKFAIVFITLVRDIGQITGISNTFQKMFEFSKSEVINKNINIIIPPIIAIKHQMILNGFVKRGANNHNFLNFRFILGQNKRGFLIPLMLKLKIEVVGRNDFGVSGILRKVSDKLHYMVISEQFKISGISEGIFKDMFSKNYSIQESRQFNISKMIPLFLAIIQEQEELQIQETEESNDECESPEQIIQKAKEKEMKQQIKKESEETVYETVMLVNQCKSAKTQLQQRTHTVETDVKELKLSQCDVYRVLFKVQLLEQHGFKYYTVIFLDYIPIPKKTTYFFDAISMLAQQLDEAYELDQNILLELVNQCLQVQQNEIYSPKNKPQTSPTNLQAAADLKLKGQAGLFQMQQSLMQHQYREQQNGEISKGILKVESCQLDEEERSYDEQEHNNEDEKSDKHKRVKQNSKRFISTKICQSEKEINQQHEGDKEKSESFVNNPIEESTGQTQSQKKISQNQTQQQQQLEQLPPPILIDNYKIEEQDKPLQLKYQNYKNQESKSPLSVGRHIFGSNNLNKLLNKQGTADKRDSFEDYTFTNNTYNSQQNEEEKQDKVELNIDHRIQNFKNKVQYSFRNQQTQNIEENEVNEATAVMNREEKERQNKRKRRTIIKELNQQIKDNNSLSKISISSNESSAESRKIDTPKQQPRILKDLKRSSQRKATVSIQDLLRRQMHFPNSDQEINSIKLLSQDSMSKNKQQINNIQQPDSQQRNSNSNLAAQIQQICTQQSQQQQQQADSLIAATSRRQLITTTREYGNTSFSNIQNGNLDNYLKSPLHQEESFLQLNQFGKDNQFVNSPQTQQKVQFQENELIKIQDPIKSHISNSAQRSEEQSNVFGNQNNPDFYNSSSEISDRKGVKIQQKGQHEDNDDQDEEESEKSSIKVRKNVGAQNNNKARATKSNKPTTFIETKNKINKGNNQKNKQKMGIEFTQKVEKLQNMQMNEQEDDSKSQQSESSKRNQFFQKQIMALIKSKKRDSVITGIQFLGFVVLIGIGLSTLIIYLNNKDSFKQMENNLEYVSWPLMVNSKILFMIKGNAMFKYFKNNVFQYEETKLKQYIAEQEDKMNENFKILLQLMEKPVNKETASYKVFRDQLNIDFDFIYSDYNMYDSNGYVVTSYLSCKISYVLQIYKSLLFGINSYNNSDTNNEAIAVANYDKTIHLNEKVSESMVESQLELSDKLNSQLYISLFGMVLISLLFALSIFPLQMIISSNSQRVLKFFSTFSPELLTQMHLQLNSFSKNIKMSSNNGQNSLSQKMILLFSQISIEKKRSISETNELPKVVIIHLLLSLIFFFLIIVYPVANFIISHTFINQQLSNVILLEKLFFVDSFLIENQDINYLVSYKLMFEESYPSLDLDDFLEDAEQHIILSKSTMDELQDILKSQDLERKKQQTFYNFVFTILEGNACYVLRDNPSYFNSDFDYDKCISLRDGIFEQGLIVVLHYIFETIPKIQAAYSVTDPVLFREQLILLQKEANFIDIDNDNLMISAFIDGMNNFILELSKDYFTLMTTIQMYLIAYQCLILFLVFYFGWVNFCQKLQEQLFKSKQLFSFINITFLMENPYFFSYFSNKKFKI